LGGEQSLQLNMHMVIVPSRKASLRNNIVVLLQTKALLKVRLNQYSPEGRVLGNMFHEFSGALIVNKIILFVKAPANNHINPPS